MATTKEVFLPSSSSSTSTPRPPSGPVARHPPLDGGWGWAVVVGCCLFHICMAGIHKSFGVLLVGFIERFPDASVAAISGFGAVAFSLIHIAAPIATFLIRRGANCRTTVLSAGALMASGCFASAFVTNVAGLYFTFGAFVGVGLGMGYTSGMVMVGTYFEKRRGLAMGMATAGSGVGGLVLAPVWRRLFDEYGYRWTLLMVGAVMLHVCLVGSLYRPIEDNYPEKRSSHDVSKHRKSVSVDVSKSTSGAVECLRRLGFDVTIIKEAKFTLYLLAFNLTAPAMIGSWAMTQPLAISTGISSNDAALLVSVNSVCDVLGRVGAGVFSDVHAVKRHRPLILAGLALLHGLADIAVIAVSSFVGFAVYSVVYGLLNGSVIASRAIVLQDIMGGENLANTFGLFNFLTGFGLFAVPLISAVLADTFASYRAPFVFNGTIVIIAAAFLAGTALIHRSHIENHR